jgi:hypothetical protein
MLAALCILFPMGTFAVDTKYKIVSDGGSTANVKASPDGKLYIDPNSVRIMRGKDEIANILASAITEISYGRDVHKRVGAAVDVGVFTLGVSALFGL